MFIAPDYLDLTQTDHPDLFPPGEQVWTTLTRIGGYLETRLTPGCEGSISAGAHVGERVFIGEGTVVEPGAVIKGPAWIGRRCQIRPGAYIRENVIIGDDCVIGNSCEFKNAILFHGCQVPHYSYVGDSILGARAHLGAGVILSNFKLAGDQISIHHDGSRYPTGLRKFGAIVGDGAEIGCHTVLNPGSIIGRRAMIYPGVVWRGVLPQGARVKNQSVHQVDLASRD